MVQTEVTVKLPRYSVAFNPNVVVLNLVIFGRLAGV